MYIHTHIYMYIIYMIYVCVVYLCIYRVLCFQCFLLSKTQYSSVLKMLVLYCGTIVFRSDVTRTTAPRSNYLSYLSGVNLAYFCAKPECWCVHVDWSRPVNGYITLQRIADLPIPSRAYQQTMPPPILLDSSIL